MKKIMLVTLATIATLYACSPNKNIAKNKTANTISVDSDGKPMLLGECSVSSLRKSPFKEWFNKNYNDYKVNDSAVSEIKQLSPGKRFLFFMGTWCRDSRREVPRMLKMLAASDVRLAQIKLVMLDDRDSVYKQSPQHQEAGLNIHRVPTFIVYENEKELGRIVESPVISPEKDMLAIFKNEGYKSNYKAVMYLDSLLKVEEVKYIQSRISEIAKAVQPIVKNSGELNTYGYVLMAANAIEKAFVVFKLNTMLYPATANVFDSMGEFYLKTNNKDLARGNYQKVLQLEPGNVNAKKMLEKLQD